MSAFNAFAALVFLGVAEVARRVWDRRSAATAAAAGKGKGIMYSKLMHLEDSIEAESSSDDGTSPSTGTASGVPAQREDGLEAEQDPTALASSSS